MIFLHTASGGGSRAGPMSDHMERMRSPACCLMELCLSCALRGTMHALHYCSCSSCSNVHALSTCSCTGCTSNGARFYCLACSACWPARGWHAPVPQHWRRPAGQTATPTHALEYTASCMSHACLCADPADQRLRSREQVQKGHFGQVERHPAF